MLSDNEVLDKWNKFNDSEKHFIVKGLFSLCVDLIQFIEKIGLINEFNESLSDFYSSLTFKNMLESRPKELGGNPLK